MAIFTTQTNGPNGVSTFSYNVSRIADYVNSTRTATQVRFFNDAANEEVFTGTGLTFDPVSGAALSGKITGYLARENGVTLVSVTGLDVDAVALGNAIGAGDTFQFFSLMSAGDDAITGSAFDDRIYLGTNVGNDTINGLAGYDSLFGGTGTDIVNGGSNGDFIAGGQGNDTLDGGDDYDTLGYNDEYLFYGGTQGITVNLSGTAQGSLLTGRAIDSFGNTDVVLNFEEVLGTGFSDTVFAAALVDESFFFSGYAGNDRFVGFSGRDGLYYGFDENFAANVFQNRGQTLAAHGIVVNFAGDTVFGDGATGTVIDSFGDTDTVSGVGFVKATFFADTFNGGIDDEEFMGYKGADIINGGGGFDVASYYQDDRSNISNSGGLTGIAGIVANFSSDAFANGISVGTVVDGYGTVDQLTNIELIDGTYRDDVMTGGADRVQFWSGYGSDTFNGGSADDFVNAGGDGDVLNGGGGSDTLIGAEGADSIVGNSGADKLLGDGSVMPTETANQIVRLYLATLGRGPDDAGLSHWTTQRDAGQSLNSIATDFVTSTEFTNKYGLNISNAAFVTLLYQNVLDRLPDTAGLNSWVTALNGGATRESVVTGFSESVEFIRASDTELHVGQTFRLYGATFGRAPDTAGFVGWVGALDDGVGILEAATLFIASPEFTARYGTGLTDTGFVTLLYQNVLGRLPDTQGLNEWLAALSGGRSRASVLLGFSDSNENITNKKAALNTFMQSVQPTWEDVLVGGSGNDDLGGGRGADTFAFNNLDNSADHVYGLEAWDTIEVTGFGFASKAAALANLTQSGANVVFSNQGDTITFHDTTVAQVSDTNWLLS